MMRFVGTALIVISLFFLSLLFLPYVLSFFPAKDVSVVRYEYAIAIPKIHASSQIVLNVDPWDKPSYDKALQKGVAHAQGSALPGENGTVYLFAHSSGPPWQLLHVNIPFLRINELQPGDHLNLFVKGKEIRYRVTAKQIVSASQVAVMESMEENQVILQTCWPIGTDWERLLVFAKPLRS